MTQKVSECFREYYIDAFESSLYGNLIYSESCMQFKMDVLSCTSAMWEQNFLKARLVRLKKYQDEFGVFIRILVIISLYWSGISTHLLILLSLT